MTRIVFLAVLTALAACGVDGPPQPPKPQPQQAPGLTISGEARMGVSGRL